MVAARVARHTVGAAARLVAALLVAALAAGGLVGCASSASVPVPAPAPAAGDASSADAMDAGTVSGDAAAGDLASGSAAAAPSTSGALQVSGGRLCGADGAPVQLRGVSTHGLAWFPQYVNADLFRELRDDWGANVVRLALYTAESGGWCTGGDRTALGQLVRDGVAWAADADLYAIVDWHVLSDQSPLVYADEAVAFFEEVSADLAERDNVLYEICNEPNGSATWDDVRAYAERVIPAIRANDPDAVVIVGTPEWSQRVDAAAADPLEGELGENVLYALHFYAATHQQPLRDRMAAAVEAGLPVFVSEFGICDASGSGAVDYASADAWVSLMDDLGVSYVCWNLSNKDESSALFAAGCAKTSGFEEGDLSAEGRWLREALSGARPAGGALSDDGGVSDGTPASAALADGVGAAASSAGPLAEAGSAGVLSWSARVRQTWEEDGRTVYLYDLTVRNNGAAPTDGWTIEVPVDGAVSVREGWNGSFDAEGSTLRVASASYNGVIPAGGQLSDVGLIVTGA